MYGQSEPTKSSTNARWRVGSVPPRLSQRAHFTLDMQDMSKRSLAKKNESDRRRIRTEFDNDSSNVNDYFQMEKKRN